MDENQRLSFGKSLLVIIKYILIKKQSFSFVSSQSQQNRKCMEDVIDIFEERVKVEEQYAKSMEKIVSNINKLHDKQKLGRPQLWLLKGYIQSKAQQSQTLVVSLKEDLIKSLKEEINLQNITFKKLNEEGKKLEKDLQRISDEVKKYNFDMRLKKRDYEQQATIMVVYNLLTEYNEEKRIKQYYRANDSKKEVDELEKKYKQKIEENNSIFDTYSSKMMTIMDVFEEQEESRLNMTRDSLMKLIIFEVSLAKNIQYDLEKITEKVHELNTEKDVQQFIMENQSPLTQYTKQEATNYNSFISESLNNFFSKEYDSQLNGSEIKEIPEVTDFFQKVWCPEQVTIEDINEFMMLFESDMKVRKQFINLLMKKRNDQEFLLTEGVYNNLVSVVKLMLDKCYKLFEAYTLQKLMVLSFSFCKNNNHYLHSDILKHPVWLNRDYWETAIICQIYEQLKKQTKSQTQSEQILKEKNTILVILTQLSQNMLLFNFSIDHIKDIMLKFCSFFSLNQDISSDLFNAIDGFDKNKQDSIKKDAPAPQAGVINKVSQFFAFQQKE